MVRQHQECAVTGGTWASLSARRDGLEWCHLRNAERHAGAELVQHSEAVVVPLPRSKVGGGHAGPGSSRKQHPGAKVVQCPEAARVPIHRRTMGWDVPASVCDEK